VGAERGRMVPVAREFFLGRGRTDGRGVCLLVWSVPTNPAVCGRGGGASWDRTAGQVAARADRSRETRTRTRNRGERKRNRPDPTLGARAAGCRRIGVRRTAAGAWKPSAASRVDRAARSAQLNPPRRIDKTNPAQTSRAWRRFRALSCPD
jgi:hypothetical protein